MILKGADDRAADIAELKRLKEISPQSFAAAIQKKIDNIFSDLGCELIKCCTSANEVSAAVAIGTFCQLGGGADLDIIQPTFGNSFSSAPA